MCGAAQPRRQQVFDVSCSGVSGTCKADCKSPLANGDNYLVAVAPHELAYDERQVRIQWWGDRGPGTLVHLLPGHPQALVHFPVRCSSGFVLSSISLLLPLI